MIKIHPRTLIVDQARHELTVFLLEQARQSKTGAVHVPAKEMP